MVGTVAGYTWGTKKAVLKVIYSQTIKSDPLYGAEIWGERRSDFGIKWYQTVAKNHFFWESAKLAGPHLNVSWKPKLKLQLQICSTRRVVTKR